MVQIRAMNIADVENVSSFILELNNIEESHIGYCGKYLEEIAHSLKDLSDIEYTESFVTAFEQNQLIGVLGFDADLEDNSAEIWGPFIRENKWDIVFSMWSEMSKLLPSEIHSISMFPNKKNGSVQKLAYNLGFIEQSEQTILTFYRFNRSVMKDVPTKELTPDYFLEMKQLHNKEFPGTYYSGQQIIDRLDKHRKVFMFNDNNSLSGYIYVEADPEFGEGSIEFFAVKESERGKGIGGHLLSVALKWLFTFETIGSTTLCVNSGNENAINFYKKVGFQHTYDLCFFTKKI